ncbi:MAG: corrinoid protein [Candidatus Rokubacteria bacterium]|nr:corrinoid protein [Candidatus Rokubacteria bacterium]
MPDGWQTRVPPGWDWSELWVAVEKGKHKVAHEIVQKAIDTGINPKTILDDGLFPGFNLQGERFSEQIIFIPEMLITARAMKAGLALIRPLLAAQAEKPVGTFVIGTVLGDMHDIGQSIVTIMLENAGFKVLNLGTDTHPDKFINTARAEKADLVGFSALLSTTIYYQKVTIEEFVKAGLRNKVKILVGGAPTSQQWADEIGADGWGKDAMLAVQLAKKLVNEPREPWD